MGEPQGHNQVEAMRARVQPLSQKMSDPSLPMEQKKRIALILGKMDTIRLCVLRLQRALNNALDVQPALDRSALDAK